MGPKYNDRHSYRAGETQRHRGEDHVEMEAEMEDMQLQAQELEGGLWKFPCLRPNSDRSAGSSGISPVPGI